ncbi:hypothetical protein, conserved [Eimeria brunetti]|uniref:RRM domain-containing protein n=1 Tax=Eimeria brunetti TaxID=51314 RepID=U6M0K4_9EIME|nr:hypothetical protein, conserved [Eimeria brunetti]
MLGRRRKTVGGEPSGCISRGRWREELEGGGAAVLPALSEEDLKLLQEDEEQQQQEGEQQQQQQEGEQQQQQEPQQQQKKKRKRFEWMDSDDESVTASSSDEEEEQKQQQQKQQQQQQQRESSDMSRSPTPEASSRDPPVSPAASGPGRSSSSSNSNSSSSSSSLSLSPGLSPNERVGRGLSSSSSGSSSSSSPASMLEELSAEHQMRVTAVFLTNLPFEVSAERIKKWFSSFVSSVVVDMQRLSPPPPAAAAAAAAAAAGDSHFRQRDHSGRLFLLLQTAAEVKKALKLLQAAPLLHGRRVAAFPAYTLQGRAFPLQTPTQIRFFARQPLQQLKNKCKDRHKFRPIDGGCIWLP